ncbi:DUF397 domain-containing protein [Actinokineospora globicatena]|uniref:DUF397 domain-containing protein n=1 Tax=Actinokineospora globicatena TaxID=103729 RepID=UPI0020A291F3|nr:DUF397 domain-containing protein [Actinokineospora globicatena]MCP2302498.1 protein of unknown function (DUF397) [Actinokineospora globicatena]GLW75817.1 hypothetical protein Aglo01_02990 [Actinokineospora globicatena]GLW82655.1 hypothetical protein Aglo02_02960 [Actinokineospora globicatena]
MPDWTTIPFHKSTHSGTNGGNCVEIGFHPGVVAVRDSKSPTGALLVLPATAWTEALASLK